MQSWPPPYLQCTETNKESDGDRGVNWSCFERMSSDNNVHILVLYEDHRKKGVIASCSTTLVCPKWFFVLVKETFYLS